MSRHHRRDRPREEYGQSWEMAAALWNGPRTLDEIVDHFRSYVRFLGLFSVTERLERHDRSERMMAFVKETLENLIERGWVVRQGERYALTPLGREEANTVLSELREAGALLRRFVQPQTVSQVSLGVHLGLAALKLPVGLLASSVGLINDATDTLLDGLSSLLVYAGLRFDKERAANVVLVLLMLVTGSFTFYEAVRRFLVPFQPEVDWFTFLAAVLSALICLALYAYQRFVGLRSGSMALITQSVDSRNHVIVAASVTAGLVASLLRFPLLDTLVGLAVALLILKSAVELAIELVRSLGEEEADLSRYRMGLVEKYEQFRQAQLRVWMLYLVEKRGVQARSELIAQARQALDFGRNPTLRALGLASEQPQSAKMIEQSVAELFERGWLMGDERLSVTDVGREQVSQGMWGTRGQRHRLSAGKSWHDQRPFDHAWGRRRADVGANREVTTQ
jgi:Co/Zn/Cd efflux system component